jgi:hypothetical protein
MRRRLALAVVLSLAAAGNASSQEVGQQFRANCMRCHQAPDLTFATDRAWLDQVHRTS